jgi:hypothetical protein
MQVDTILRGKIQQRRNSVVLSFPPLLIKRSFRITDVDFVLSTEQFYIR